MPKCLDCNNTKTFWYTETSHKLGEYDEDGTLKDVIKDYWDPVYDGKCGKCDSINILGKL
jgi:hypothetical protein